MTIEWISGYNYNAGANSEQLLCSPTPYAIAQGAEVNDNNNGAWGLRTPGADHNGCCIVAMNGLVLGDNSTVDAKGGVYVESPGLGVRPAMNINGNHLLND